MKTSTVRLCRNNLHGHERNHYWDTSTGKKVQDPKGTQYTPEMICPKHARKIELQEDGHIDHAEHRIADR